MPSVVLRIGRTGRVGNTGRATSFFDERENAALARPLVKVIYSYFASIYWSTSVL